MTNDEAEDMAALAVHLDRQLAWIGQSLTPTAHAARAQRLTQHAKALSRYAVLDCNGDLTEVQQLKDRNVQGRVEDICKAYVVLVDFGCDPRGYVVKLHFTYGKDKPYNTWGGAESGWGIG